MIDELDHLAPDEKSKLSAALRDLTADGPRTEHGLSRFRRLATKAGIALGMGLYKVAVAVGTETVKKALLGA